MMLMNGKSSIRLNSLSNISNHLTFTATAVAAYKCLGPISCIPMLTALADAAVVR